MANVGLTREEIEFVVGAMPGLRVLKKMNVALLCLTREPSSPPLPTLYLPQCVVYEHVTTLDEEIRYFWRGRWTLSRILFLLNRYMLPFVTTECYTVLLSFVTLYLFHQVICTRLFLNFGAIVTVARSCRSVVSFAFIAEVIVMAIVQATLVVRAWYLLSSRISQYALLSVFIATFIITMVFMHYSVSHLQVLPNFALASAEFRNGCKVARPPGFGRVYLPSLVLHAILYIITAYRALANRQLLKHAPVMKRLVRDGGFFLLVVFLAVGFTTIGSFLRDINTINLPAIFSPFLLTTTSIAVSRVMFSVHCLASRLGSDQPYLLNELELKRAGCWRKGPNQGEIIIERYSPGADDYDSDGEGLYEYDKDKAKGSSDSFSMTAFPSRSMVREQDRIGVKETRVGELEKGVWVKGVLNIEGQELPTSSRPGGWAR
ncbi:hypothetical protein AX16_005327 [Volvariella volvacea WC 439]|nr:hypothetical protein AX16_005327 [Volvariella volvacea WC 439]